MVGGITMIRDISAGHIVITALFLMKAFWSRTSQSSNKNSFFKYWHNTIFISQSNHEAFIFREQDHGFMKLTSAGLVDTKMRTPSTFESKALWFSLSLITIL